MASNPAAGSGLESTPTAIKLTFSEVPDPSLASIKVTDGDGAPVAVEPAEPVTGDPHTLSVRVPNLSKGVYTVDWRVVSRIDGHRTGGAFSFGIGVTPEQAQLAAGASATSTPAASPVEVVGRLLFLAGVVMLLGAACAGAADFAGAGRGLALAGAAWPVTALGIGVLVVAQRSSAAVGFGDFLGTYAGGAIQGRSAALVVAGGALLAARAARSATAARVALGVAAGAAAAMIAVHVAAGHAATASSSGRWITIATQWSHAAAIGIWIGGLAALLIGTLGAPSPDKAGAVRRFSRIAAVALAVVVASGVARSFGAIGSWHELISSGYGQLILVKVALVGFIALLALRNRLRSVPAAATTLHPLRRVSAGELTLAGVAIVAAAALGSLSPPVDVHPLGLTVDGTDASGAVQARLVTDWAVPGPNHFAVRLDDRATGKPFDARRVTLRFVPLDDPGESATTLPLDAEQKPGAWVGSGNNLAFPGRWQVSVIAERAADSLAVPLELHIDGPPLFLSVDAFPGMPVRYSVQLADNSFIRLTVEPASPGRQHVTVEFFEYFSDRRPVRQLTLTATGTDQTTRQLPVRRQSSSSFVSDADLAPGPTEIAVIGRTADGTRLYGTYEVDIARG